MRDTPPIFQLLERLQGDRPWGSMLDAGTGARSARWMAGLPTTRWTAVSADPAMLAETRAALGPLRAADRLLAGNWSDAAFLAGERHDTVLAEYLLGAVQPYAPGLQPRLFARLRPLVGQRLYVIGLDPYAGGQGGSADDRLLRAIGRFRDGCLRRAGLVPYREYPAEWVLARLGEAGMAVRFARRFPNLYDARWVGMQLSSAAEALQGRAPACVVARMAAEAETLRARAAAHGVLRSGADYVIMAEPA
ncbi:class I SAM-dependent methyltransferase [Roseomonas sp. 18066]|uniref:class I SAM-dependent methyltransferase n=1 Tax=Roseomonas sp. 18066 TaxID=2681412 RepID=UPI00135B8546|nr:class I SAM-dependent methyltransferase [Roseomonas sp. 18066]